MELKPTSKVAEALAIAQRAAQSQGHPEITPHHLALALAEQPDTTTPALLAAGGTTPQAGAAATPSLGPAPLAALNHASTVMQAMGDTYLSTDVLLLALVEKGAITADAKAIEVQIPQLRRGQKVTSESPEATGEALDKYGTDLTGAARDGKLDPVIGRDSEIRRVIQVL